MADWHVEVKIVLSDTQLHQDQPQVEEPNNDNDNNDNDNDNNDASNNGSSDNNCDNYNNFEEGHIPLIQPTIDALLRSFNMVQPITDGEIREAISLRRFSILPETSEQFDAFVLRMDNLFTADDDNATRDAMEPAEVNILQLINRSPNPNPTTAWFPNNEHNFQQLAKVVKSTAGKRKRSFTVSAKTMVSPCCSGSGNALAITIALRANHVVQRAGGSSRVPRTNSNRRSLTI